VFLSALLNQITQLPFGPAAIPPHWSAAFALGATAMVSAATIEVQTTQIAARFRKLFTIKTIPFSDVQSWAEFG
jgi:hypothetical protein